MNTFLAGIALGAALVVPVARPVPASFEFANRPLSIVSCAMVSRGTPSLSDRRYDLRLAIRNDGSSATTAYVVRVTYGVVAQIIHRFEKLPPGVTVTQDYEKFAQLRNAEPPAVVCQLEAAAFIDGSAWPRRFVPLPNLGVHRR
ncbi:MAG: hypothetical protein ACXWNK_17050 [Vulcanimicrobiaceae bacterium]